MSDPPIFSVLGAVVGIVNLGLVIALLREVRFIRDHMSRRRVVKRKRPPASTTSSYGDLV